MQVKVFSPSSDEIKILLSMQYLSGHGGHVPHVTDDGPAGHHSKQVAHHVVFTTVPKRITKLRIILRKENAF